MKILVTGGCGFIGSNFIRHMLLNYCYEILNLDALTYAGNPQNLKDLESDPRYHFIHGRVEDLDRVMEIMKEVDAVFHFAAESHVDKSILTPQTFSITNIIGTQTLLEASRKLSLKRFIHISTDEVYGELGKEGIFTEDRPLKPNSSYSATKAWADLLVMAYYRTYNVAVIIVRPSNNYGPYQYPEKFIPLMITNLIEGNPVPLYGKGQNIRDWLYVGECSAAIDKVLHEGRIGEIYNVGGQNEVRNIDVARKILRFLGKDEGCLRFVPDRPGHDFRYALDISKIKREIGWEPSLSFEEGLEKTITWYRENKWWWQPLKRELEKESRGFWT